MLKELERIEQQLLKDFNRLLDMKDEAKEIITSGRKDMNKKEFLEALTIFGQICGDIEKKSLFLDRIQTEKRIYKTANNLKP